jgi:hypothetical protein
MKEQTVLVYVVIKGQEPIIAKFKSSKDAMAYQEEVRSKLQKEGVQFATAVHYKG